MKHFYNLILILFLFVTVNSVKAQDTVVCNLHNFNIEGGNKFSYDIYALRLTSGNFIMGNSSFVVKFNARNYRIVRFFLMLIQSLQQEVLLGHTVQCLQTWSGQEKSVCRYCIPVDQAITFQMFRVHSE